LAFRYERGSSSVLGVGVSGSGKAGTFNAGGTRSMTSTLTYDFAELIGVNYKVYSTDFQYDKWLSTCRDTRGNTWRDWEFGVAHFTGGQYTVSGPRLGMGYCKSHGANDQFSITSTTAYDGGGDVASAGVISINLSARTGYSTTTSIWWHFLRTHPLCGYRGYEGFHPQLFTTHNS
jgi:hypothetical protein